jgi:Methyltransferase small domain
MLFRVKNNFSKVINDYLNRIPYEAYIHGKVIDPAMGGGQIMQEIEKRKRESGLSLDEIRKTCYGYAENIMNLNYAKNKHGLVGNYKASDPLHGDEMREFDTMITNPPYKVDNDKNYYVKFIDLADQLVKSDGYIAFIIPNRFLSPGSRAAKEISNCSIEISTVFADLNKHFPGIGTSIGGFIGRRCRDLKWGRPIHAEFIFNDGVMQERNLDDATPIMGTSLLSTKIIDKVFKSKLPKMVIDNKTESKNYLFLATTYVRYRSTTPVGGEKTLDGFVNETSGTGVFIPCKTKKQAEVAKWFLTRSKLGRFAVYSFANSSFANSSPVHHKNMPMIPEDTKMNDQAIYNLFKLTNEEIALVESKML